MCTEEPTKHDHSGGDGRVWIGTGSELKCANFVRQPTKKGAERTISTQSHLHHPTPKFSGWCAASHVPKVAGWSSQLSHVCSIAVKEEEGGYIIEVVGEGLSMLGIWDRTGGGVGCAPDA